MTPDQILEKLMEGNRRFREGETIHPHQNIDARNALTKGQWPSVCVVACADSRVPPNLLFDQGLGDIFVIRVAGQVMGPSGLGSIEYAVEYLNVSLVILMGHSSCGAVAAAVSGEKNLPGHLNELTKRIHPVMELCGSRERDTVARANAIMQTNQLRELELLKSQVEKGKLKIVSAYYHLDSGEVELLDEDV